MPKRKPITEVALIQYPCLVNTGVIEAGTELILKWEQLVVKAPTKQPKAITSFDQLEKLNAMRREQSMLPHRGERGNSLTEVELPFGCLRGVFYPRVLRVSVECVNHLFCVLARLLNYFTVVEGGLYCQYRLLRLLRWGEALAVERT